MSWLAITYTNVEAALSGPELQAYRRVAGNAAGEDDDKLAEVIKQVTNEIRSHIEDCAENRLGADGTLPERLHYHAVAIIRNRLMNRLGMAISDGRKTEYEDAVKYLHRVSECKVKIERPDAEDIVEESSLPEIEIVSGAEPQSTRQQLGGLY